MRFRRAGRCESRRSRTAGRVRLCRIEQTPRGIAGPESGLSVLSVMGKDNETDGGLRRIGQDAPLLGRNVPTPESAGTTPLVGGGR